MAAQTEVAGWSVDAGVEPAGGVERDPLRVAEPPGKDLLAGAVQAEPQDLPAQAAGGGGARRHVALTGGGVEPAIGAELEAPAEVVTGPTGDAVEQHLLADQRVALDREARDAIGVAPRSAIGVIEEDVGRLDGDPQQPTLAAVGGDDAQRERRRRKQLAIANDAHPPRSFREPDGAIGCEGQRPGSDQAVGHRFNCEVEGLRRGECGRGRRRRGTR